jgi:hypothetical protein
MSACIVLPYDGSPAARATLLRAARLARREPGRFRALLVAAGGVERLVLEDALHEARTAAESSVPVILQLLDRDHPIRSLVALLEMTPAAWLAASIGRRGCTSWYEDACRLGTFAESTILFFPTPEERRQRPGMAEWVRPSASFPRSSLRHRVLRLFRRAPSTAMRDVRSLPASS